MSRVLLDTDTLSEIIKGRDPTVLLHAEAYLDEHEQLTVTSVSVSEVLFGLKSKQALAQIRAFEDIMLQHEEVTPSSKDYRLAADISAALKRAGTPIGPYDPLIAACAVQRGLPLVTGNTRHYAFIQASGYNLKTLNWRTQN